MTVRELSQELQEEAKKAVNEDPKRIPEDIKYIKEWIGKQPYLVARTDDQWILAFLRGCESSLNATKERFDSFYTMKSILPEYWQNRDPLSPAIQKTLESGFYLPLLTTKSPSSERTFIFRFAALDPKRPIQEYIKVMFMIHDILTLEDDHIYIGGGELIQDMKGFSTQHMTQWTPSTIKKFTTCVQSVHPVNPKRNIFINTPSVFQTFYSLFESFCTDKFKQKTKVYRSENTSKLYDDIPKKILPKEYGGNELSIKELTAYWKKKVESYREWFLEDEKYKTDESKRPGAPKSVSNVFGMEGSFRKLDLD